MGLPPTPPYKTADLCLPGFFSVAPNEPSLVLTAKFKRVFAQPFYNCQVLFETAV